MTSEEFHQEQLEQRAREDIAMHKHQYLLDELREMIKQLKHDQERK